MNILLVTGKSSHTAISNLFAHHPAITAHPATANIASFITPAHLLSELTPDDVKNKDFIVVPGQAPGDYSIIERTLGVPCVKGPRHLTDLPLFLSQLETTTFSPRDPADTLLADLQAQQNTTLLAEARKKKTFTPTIGDPPLLLTSYPHVIAEICDAPRLTPEDITQRASHFQQSGAGIIDLGMLAGEDNSDAIAPLVEILRKTVDAPLSIDTLNPAEITAAADADADLVLSLTEATLELASTLDVPAVIIPQDAKGTIPDSPKKRVNLLTSMLKTLEGQGYSQAIADPLLNPPIAGLAASIHAYRLIRSAHPDTPLLMGAGNVTELIDADSPGVNALLACLACELDVSLLLATEESHKTRGAIAELATAANLCYLAKARGQAPKDLGVDLLALKDKRPYACPEDDALASMTPRKAPPSKPALEARYVKVYLKDDAIHVACYEDDTPTAVLTGTDAPTLYRAAVKRDFVGSREHASYLGRELAKAEIALALGKNYIQDDPLFQ